MADRVIDRLVSSLADGRMDATEFMQAVECQASEMKPVAGAAAAEPCAAARSEPSQLAGAE
jgi:hypothetical protein